MGRVKQVAIKTSGKGKNAEPSSSSMPFVDAHKALKKRSLLAERGFNFVSPNPAFLSTVAALGWEKFVLHRKEFIAPLVREFYEGIEERNDGKPSTVSKCRSAEIIFDARTINDHYGLGYFGKAIENKQLKYGLAEMNEVKDRICIEEAVWEKSGAKGNEFKIAAKYLCDEANLWFRFVRHSLLPTGHTLFVDKERLLVIDAIMSRENIEVGKLINREINKWRNRVDGNLYFPCLITDLCMEAGCEIEAGELREKPSGAFDTKFKPRKRPGNASTSVDAQTLQRLVQQQTSMARFVKDQFEWQKKIAAHLTKGKMTIQEPALPEWMQAIDDDEEDEEDKVPLSTLHLKKVKQEKAKKMRSPAKKKQSPAKKKQKKSSSEEEFRSSDLDLISDPSDEKETTKIAEEVSSGEEEGTESEGSSSERTDTQKESPPTKETTLHPSKAAKPKTPTKFTSPQPSPEKQPTIDQTIPETPQPTLPEVIIPQPPPTETTSPEKDQAPAVNEPEPEPAKEPIQPSAVQEESPVIPQPQPSVEAQPQQAQDPDVVASEAAQGTEVVKKTKKRVKQVPTEGPVKRKKRGASTATGEGSTASVETGGEVQQQEQAEVQRQKLEVRKKQKTDKSIPASGSASVAESTGPPAGSKDAVASKVPEVEKAPSDPVSAKETSDAELLQQKTWEEAKKRLSENMAIHAESKQPAPAVSEEPAAAFEGDAAAKEDVAEKKKDKKKKKRAEQSSQLPPRQSGRLRSGALQK